MQRGILDVRAVHTRVLYSSHDVCLLSQRSNATHAEGNYYDTFAPVVEKVAPSVVTFHTQTVRADRRPFPFR